MHNRSAQKAFILATSLLVFAFSLLTTSDITFLLKGQITQLQFWTSTTICMIYTLASTKFILGGRSLKVGLSLFGVMAAAFAGGLVISGLFTDLSFDGQGYHEAGIIALDKGWNPLFQNINSRRDIISENKLWIQSYPHANDILSLNIYKVTGNVEDAKALTAFWIVISGLICFVALSALRLNGWLSLILLAVALLNPVSILQIYTFGLDSQYYSMMLSLVGLIILAYKNFRQWFVYPGVVIVSIFMINNKLTSVEGLVIIGACGCLYAFVTRHFRMAAKIGAMLLVGLFLGLLAYGYQPFVTNYVQHKTPFYPAVSGSNRQAYNFSENKPSNYLSVNTASLFAQSIFFKSNGYFRKPKDGAKLKIPFTFSKTELNSLIYLGPKEGGFGVLFSGIVVTLILFVLMLAFVRKTYKGNRREAITLILAAAVVVLSCVTYPLNSDYRYIPQFWLLVPIVLWLSWKFRDGKVVAMNVIIILLVLINSLFVFMPAASASVSMSYKLDGYMRTLSAQSKKQPIRVNFAQSEGNEFLLKKYGVAYVPSKTYSGAFMCADGLEVTPLLHNIGTSSALMCAAPSINSAQEILASSWSSYIKRFDVSGRIIDPENGDLTTSEGQSYALLRAVWEGDRSTFDSVWGWTAANLAQSSGLLTWKWQPGVAQNKLDEGTAPDADEDTALAMLFAYQKWHQPGYLGTAQHILDGIWSHEVAIVSGKPYMSAGNWANDSTSVVVDPSYLSPASYAVFALADRTHPWAELEGTSYDILTGCTEASLDTVNGGLPPNWCLLDKRTLAVGPTVAPQPVGTVYGYDAFRVPDRIALDYEWFKDPRAKAYLATLSVLDERWNSNKKLASVYRHNGSVSEGSESTAAYAGDLGYFIVMDPGVAKEIYASKILPRFSQGPLGAYWADPKNYYTQNWAWFGTAIYTNNAPSLWTSSR